MKKAFDQDLIPVPQDKLQFQFSSPERWCWQGVPNGGYLLAVAAKAMSESLEHKDPISLSATFANRTALTTIDAQVNILGQGRSLSQATASLEQNGSVCVHAMGVFGDFASRKGSDYTRSSMPELPAPELCEHVKFDNCSFPDNVDILLTPESVAAMAKQQAEPEGICGWIRLADSDEADLLALLMFADAFPRAIEAIVGEKDWMPTLDYTVQCFAKPAPGYIACRFTVRRVNLGLLEDCGELWDSEGNLVAVCRQSVSVRLTEEEEHQLVQHSDG